MNILNNLFSSGNLLPTLQEFFVILFILIGCFFLFVGALGLLRLPDVYNRLHATSKSTTLGAASIFFSGFIYFGFQGMGLTSLVGVFFLFLTAPTGSHMISRAAQKMGVEFFGDITWPIESDIKPLSKKKPSKK
tara:strand:- start:865 stop:1266 length:402 start_codon:yes stop_codon:yes gene_type:complete